jgi:hypothetical protein
MQRSFQGWKLCAALGIAISSYAIFAQVAAVADESVPSSIKGAPATHKQQKILTVAKAESGEKLEDFCLDTKGRILALLGPNDQGMGMSLSAIAGIFSKKGSKFESAVHVYNAEGNLVSKWPVGFSGQAINTAPDGTIVIGGNGHVARFSADGEKLCEAESPQMTYINNNQDEMRERAKEQLESDKVTFAEQVKQFEEQLKELRKAKPKESGDKKSEKPNEAAEDGQEPEIDEKQLEQIVQSYKQHLKALEKKTVDQSLQEVLGRAKTTHSITASEREVFVSCPALAGYGFGVWRTDEKFGNAKEIIKSLSGCCGQMDVQCCKGELYVCENSRHRVIRFDRDGKEIGQFGKRDRTGEGENFGGCCNPMNLCFSKEGNLYVSESNGVVKHFTPSGKYLGIVGIAAVQPGCKNSCVGVTADDKRLFYIDVHKSQIILLAREESSGTE